MIKNRWILKISNRNSGNKNWKHQNSSTDKNASTGFDRELKFI